MFRFPQSKYFNENLAITDKLILLTLNINSFFLNLGILFWVEKKRVKKFFGYLANFYVLWKNCFQNLLKWEISCEVSDALMKKKRRNANFFNLIHLIDKFKRRRGKKFNSLLNELSNLNPKKSSKAIKFVRDIFLMPIWENIVKKLEISTEERNQIFEKNWPEEFICYWHIV